MTIDLTKNPDSYVYHLERMSPSIKDMFYAPECTLLKMIDTVRAAVLKAKATPARRRFLMQLVTECFSKHDVQKLCYNAIAKGKNYQTY